jgi:anti-sigma regulatory factor (Ser/Thr protein kinase)
MTVTVAEPDHASRQQLRRLLLAAGFDVEEHRDGARIAGGLAVLDTSAMELIADGVRAVVLAADHDPEAVMRAMRAGAWDLHAKPPNPAALVDSLRKIAHASPEETLKVLSATPEWLEADVPCTLAATERLQNFVAHLLVDLSAPVREGIVQAFHELLVNAVEWGGELDAHRTVRVAYVRGICTLVCRIADPGRGFNLEDLRHCALCNPAEEHMEHLHVRQEKGMRPGGYGILLSRKAVDELVYNEPRNEVMFVKYLER